MGIDPAAPPHGLGRSCRTAGPRGTPACRSRARSCVRAVWGLSSARLWRTAPPAASWRASLAPAGASIAGHAIGVRPPGLRAPRCDAPIQRNADKERCWSTAPPSFIYIDANGSRTREQAEDPLINYNWRRPVQRTVVERVRSSARLEHTRGGCRVAKPVVNEVRV